MWGSSVISRASGGSGSGEDSYTEDRSEMPRSGNDATARARREQLLAVLKAKPTGSSFVSL